MGCAAAYFLPIPSTERCIRVRSDFLNVSLVSLRAKFYTARHISCLYKIDLVNFIVYIKNKASYQVILWKGFKKLEYDCKLMCQIWKLATL